MKNRILLLIVSLVFLGQAFGQGFTEGYIIFNDGTKITGLVEKKRLADLGNSIKYKVYADSQPEIIPLSNVSEFGYGKKIFFKAYVRVDLSGLNQFTQVKKYDDFFSTDTIFLQVMFEGDKPLYRGYYNHKDLFYILQNDSLILLEAPQFVMQDTVMDPTLNRLVNRYNYQINTEVTTQKQIVILETYKYQLSSYLSDWPGIDQRLRDIAYNYYSMRYLFKHYYNYKNPGKIKTNEMSGADVGIFAGEVFEKVNITSSTDMFYYLSKPDFPISSSYYVGVFGQTNFKQTDYHLSLYYSLGYYNLQTEDLIIKSYIPGKELVYTYSSFDMTSLKIRLAGKFNLFINKNLLFSIVAGGTYTVPIKAHNYVLEYGFATPDYYVRNFEGFLSPYQKNSYIRDEAGVFAGVSLRWRRISLNTWAEVTNGFLSPLRITQRNYLYGMTLSYSIIKA